MDSSRFERFARPAVLVLLFTATVGGATIAFWMIWATFCTISCAVAGTGCPNYQINPQPTF